MGAKLAIVFISMKSSIPIINRNFVAACCIWAALHGHVQAQLGSWGPVDVLNPNAFFDGTGDNDTKPFLVDNGQTILASWSTPAGGTAIRRSSTGGASWDAPTFYAREAVSQRPFHFLGDNRWVMLASAGPGLGRVLHLSVDDGLTFGEPYAVGGNFTVVGSNGDGLLLRYELLFGGGAELSRSTDFGQTWTDVKPLSFHVTRFVYTGEERWLAVTTDRTLMASSDNGHTWSGPIPVPVTLDDIASDGAGGVIAVETTSARAGDVHTAYTVATTSSDHGLTWQPRQTVHVQSVSNTATYAGITSRVRIDHSHGSTWLLSMNHVLYNQTTPIHVPWPVEVGVFVSATRNGGATWGAAEPALYFQREPMTGLRTDTDLTAVSAGSVLAWETNGSAQYGLEGTGPDVDLLYKRLAVDPAAAQGWGLYE